MKRSRSCDDDVLQDTADDELDPLAVALLALGQRQPQEDHEGLTSARARPRKQPRDEGHEVKVALSKSNHGRRGYVWRGPHREELTMHKKEQQQEAAAENHNSSSRRSSATQGMPSDDDEVAQQQQQQQQQKPKQRPQHKMQQQQQKQQQKQAQKDSGKEWAALTTWLRMNLHHPRTHRRIILFLGEQDHTTGAWSFSLNPEVSWQEIGLETKLRLKTLLVEAEQAYLQKYPGRPRREWGSKMQKYRPPGSSTTFEVSLWDVVNGLHSIYLQYEEPADHTHLEQPLQQQEQEQDGQHVVLAHGELQQQQHDWQQPLQQQQHDWQQPLQQQQHVWPEGAAADAQGLCASSGVVQPTGPEPQAQVKVHDHAFYYHHHQQQQQQ